jgi:hypothetical protein
MNVSTRQKKNEHPLDLVKTFCISVQILLKKLIEPVDHRHEFGESRLVLFLGLGQYQRMVPFPCPALCAGTPVNSLFFHFLDALPISESLIGEQGRLPTRLLLGHAPECGHSGVQGVPALFKPGDDSVRQNLLNHQAGDGRLHFYSGNGVHHGRIQGDQTVAEQKAA